LENNFTVEAWVWIDPDPGDLTVTEPGPIISAGSGEIRYQQSGWNLACRPGARIGGGSDYLQRICTFGSYGQESAPFRDTVVPISQWAHVAFVLHSDNTAQAYLNGRASAVVTDYKPPKLGPVWVGIGWHSNLGGQYWRGKLAHVAVYPLALDERRIIEHYQMHEATEKERGEKPTKQ
jgi:hypothetical protein